MPLIRIEPRRLYRQIAEQIRGLIKSGEYGFGDRLPPERDLAKQLRVSRPSVREALIALEVEGLIEVRVGSGIYVRAPAVHPTLSQLVTEDSHPPGPFELIRARRAIEGECAAIAAKEVKRGQLARIAEALQQMEDDARKIAQPLNADRRAHSAGEIVLNADRDAQSNREIVLNADRDARINREIVLNADREFHMAIAEATNNGTLVHIVRSLWEERGGPLFTKLQHHFDTPRSWASAIREHQAVYDAILERNPDAARAAMHHHMDRASRRFSRSWDERK